MKDNSLLYADILFYTKECERLDGELKSASLTEGARNRLLRERERVKSKLDGLVGKIPEISEDF